MTVDPDKLRLQQLLRLFEDIGLLVHWNKKVEGGMVSIHHYLSDRLDFSDIAGSKRPLWMRIDVHPGLSTLEKIAALRWAWANVLPDDEWDSYSIHDDRRLGPNIGMYRTTRFSTSSRRRAGVQNRTPALRRESVDTLLSMDPEVLDTENFYR